MEETLILIYTCLTKPNIAIFTIVGKNKPLRGTCIYCSILSGILVDFANKFDQRAKPNV